MKVSFKNLTKKHNFNKYVFIMPDDEQANICYHQLKFYNNNVNVSFSTFCSFVASPNVWLTETYTQIELLDLA